MAFSGSHLTLFFTETENFHKNTLHFYPLQFFTISSYTVFDRVLIGFQSKFWFAADKFASPSRFDPYDKCTRPGQTMLIRQYAHYLRDSTGPMFTAFQRHKTSKKW